MSLNSLLTESSNSELRQQRVSLCETLPKISVTTKREVIDEYIRVLKLKKDQIEKVNHYIQFNLLDWYTEVVQLNVGQSFGEIALINDVTRTASIKALSHCSFAVLGREEYEKVLKRLEQKCHQKKIDFFINLPFIGHWTRTQISKLTYSFTEL